MNRRLMNAFGPWLLAAILLGTGCGFGADAAKPSSEIPALVEWKDPSYTRRYFLRVEAPGEAGNVGLQSDPISASVVLPIKMVTLPSGKMRPEPVLLIGEDGSTQSVFITPCGSEMEVFFQTRPGLRRFCLYAGSAKGEAKKYSPAAPEFPPVKVKMRGRVGPQDFIPTEAPITLEKFKKVEESGDPGLGTRVASNISDVECPFLDIKTTQFGHIVKITNPERYTALYEGFLRAPVTGQYKFALDTPGAAHVLIDGVAVISADVPDPRRMPFALTSSVELNEGMHRVVVYYTEACGDPGKTNADLSRFGLRLHWQPPFAKDLMCVPPQAFSHAMPAVVTRVESGGGLVQPFPFIEKLAHVRTGSHLGSQRAVERVLLIVRPSGAPENAKVSISAEGLAGATALAGSTLAQWVPVDTDVTVSILGADGKAAATRTLQFPSSRNSTNAVVMELEGELAVKSAPEFLYPDEIGHIHLEAMLSPAPALIYKERLESKLLPPAPRPMGQFRMQCEVVDSTAAAAPAINEEDVTPLESSRKKIRVSLPANIEALAKSGNTQFAMRLRIGDVDIETQSLRLLHSTSPWTGTVSASPGNLVFYTAGKRAEKPGDAEAAKPADAPGIPEPSVGSGELVVMVVPYENESEYRKFAPLKALAHSDLAKEALFLGDPLVEGIVPKPGELYGLAKALAKAMPGLTWSNVPVVGPHRYLPIFRMLSDFETYAKGRDGKKIPDLVILCLGGGDVARQTPLHTFERALDAMVDRLRVAGAKKIVVVGAIPEPWREKQCGTYQDRVMSVLRQHHIDCVDIFNTWTKESDWVRYFSTDGTETTPVYGPVPNAAARERISQMIKDRL